MRASLFAAIAFSLAACSSDPTATIVVTVGDETDAFSRSPAPTTLVVESIGTDNAVKELARVALPADEISLGDVGRSDVGALRVTARDAADKRLLAGESLFVQFGVLENTPLEVFVQRLGELARLPRAPAAIDAPVLDLVSTRYIVAATGTTTQLYDLLMLRPFSTSPTLTRPARSLATYGSTALVIDEAGATSLDLSSGTTAAITTPTGGSFAEIAGGVTTRASDGSVFIVGATRSRGGPAGGPTARILKISSEGDVTFASLTTPREGACATWVEGRGLVVFGGSADGSGAEVLAPNATQAAPLPYPALAVTGCGAAALDPSHVLIVGGIEAGVVGGAPRSFDVACATNCAPTAWPGTLPLVRAQAADLAFDAALVIGDDETGASRVFRASAGELREVPLKVARKGARLLVLSNDALAIVGGNGPIEQYRE